CDKGLAENNNTVVTAAVRREEVQSSQSDYVINQTFHGSLPRFLAAFLRTRPLSKAEADELRKLIDEYEE
ncbi:MAG: BlaI/MecI/CopY family transcriptional regulator, partial [Solobacterium sp.]|nr:BlaI/MecI/CopY family transcriptional regulator [Solobacterium sp.]